MLGPSLPLDGSIAQKALIYQRLFSVLTLMPSALPSSKGDL